MSMGKRRRGQWAERDLSSPYWRRTVAWMTRAGATADLKRRVRRRERHDARRGLDHPPADL